MAKKEKARGSYLKSGSYRIRVHVGNGKYRSFTAPTKREAEMMAKRYEVDHKVYKKADRLHIAFGDALAEYIENRTNIRSSSTIRKYKSMIEGYAEINDIPICEIDNSTLIAFVNHMAAHKSYKTVLDYKNLAVSVIREKIPDAIFRINVGMQCEEDPEKEYDNMPNDFQLKAILKETREDFMKVAIYLGAFCMLREGEVAALTADDFDGNIITVSKAMKRNLDNEWVVDHTKTGKIRRVIAPQFVADAFMQLDGGSIGLNPHALGCRFKRICKRLGYDNINFHGLRKYGASSWSMENINDAYIQKAGGWSSDKVLRHHYKKTFSDAQERAFATMNKVYEQFNYG